MKLNLDRLAEYPLVSVDVETTGLHWYRDKTFGVAVAAYDGKSIGAEYYDLREKPRIIEILRDQVPRVKRLVNHNLKFDSHFLMNDGIMVPMDRIECTSVRAALINEHEGEHGHNGFDLDALARKYLGRGKQQEIYKQLADLFGGMATRGVQMKNLHRAPPRLVAEYARPDPELAILLWLWQEEEIKRQGLEKVWDLERRLMPVLIDVERGGVRVDEGAAQRAMGDIDHNVAVAQRKLDRMFGKPINVNSSPQMRAMFKVKKVEQDGSVRWYTDNGFLLETTDGGEASVGKDSLQTMRDQGDERAAHVLTIRKMLKAKQFLEAHILGHAINGRVYPNYNQTRGDNELGTGTGRFSIDDPALQQIPKRDRDIAAIIRACFLPEDGDDWACADWEQFEFRWFAHYTKDPGILQAYASNPDTDYHQIVSDITGIPRNARHAGDPNAKQINLGLVFGMGRGEMAYQMGLEYTLIRDSHGREWKRAGPKAEALFDTYHGAIPGVKKLLDQAASIARSRGYIKTVMERHIRFPGGKFTHKAGGLTFQGTSADCMKQKMVELHPVSKSEGFKILLSVHDELDFSLPKKGGVKTAKHIKKELETFDGDKCPIYCRVPIRSDVKLGPNWWEACK